jgi:hypothetical protein
LKAVLLDDANDTTSADRETGLAKLLREDVERGVGIEEAVANDLANDLVGANIVSFGPRLLAKESCAALFTKEFEQLEISLLAEAELFGCLGGTGPLALAFDEHGEPGDDEVIRKDGEFSGGSDDPVGRDVELHGLILRERSGAEERKMAPWQDSIGGLFSLINYGVILPHLRILDKMHCIDNATNY